VTAFLDLDAAQGTGGEAGGEVEFGPRIGPDALQELLCEGSVQLVGLSGGKPALRDLGGSAASYLGGGLSLPFHTMVEK